MSIELHRIDDNWIEVKNKHDIDAKILANEEVEIDKATFDEIESFLSIGNSFKELSADINLRKVVFTPDLHKGAGIPVGTAALLDNAVIPKAIGTDIGCGMSLTVLNTNVSTIDNPEFDTHLRYRFFEGGRDIALSADERVNIFRSGFAEGGDENTQYVPEEFLRSSAKTSSEKTRDDQIGSIGGGNHFVEIQYVDEIFDRHKAYAWGIKKGSVVVMAHTGSVSIGHYVGKAAQDRAKAEYPTTVQHPSGNYYPLFKDGSAERYMSEMNAAANFAKANRHYLVQTALKALKDLTGKETDSSTIYDSSHNLANMYDNGFLHRKGACPANENQPVMVPGSMGDYSFLLCGHGNPDALCSSCHGAGRKTARKGSQKYEGELSSIRLVTKLDPKKITRKDIIADYMKSLAEEAPSCYKSVGPAIDTCKGAEVSFPVARLKPILTIKGY